MKFKSGRRINKELKERVNILVQAGLSFQEIADTLNMRSRQLARYHFYTGRKVENQKSKTKKS